MSGENLDRQIRLAAFDWLSKQVEIRGEVLDYSVLKEGLQFRGEKVYLISPQGIFKPSQLLEMPLTIRTSFGGPYDDSFTSDGLLAYRYRGTDPYHPDNVGLRKTMERGTPLIYFHGIVEGKYLAVWPVFVVGDSPEHLTFKIAVDDLAYARRNLQEAEEEVAETNLPRRAYITASVRHRLHQQSFRERVLKAYQEQCSLCRLRHKELLDAAHIIADADPEGMPVIQNGLALCKLHHAAFDRHILGITPDYVAVIRQDILEEIDGPMLRHGLQGLHKKKIWVPRSQSLRPDRNRLAARYEDFRKAG